MSRRIAEFLQKWLRARPDVWHQYVRYRVQKNIREWIQNQWHGISVQVRAVPLREDSTCWYVQVDPWRLGQEIRQMHRADLQQILQQTLWELGVLPESAEVEMILR